MKAFCYHSRVNQKKYELINVEKMIDFLAYAVHDK